MRCFWNRKNYIRYLILSAALLMLVVFSACSGDDDELTVPDDSGQTATETRADTNTDDTVADNESSTDATAEAKPSQAALDAVAWAVEIANDDSFTYGVGDRAHRCGCYFCGTNSRKKGDELQDGHSFEKTYCCNPFIFAAYAHGAQIPSILESCQSGGAAGMVTSQWTKHGFEVVGETSDIPCEDLLPGDVILSDREENNWAHHVWMVTDSDHFVEASRDGWDPESIAVESGLKDRYARYQEHLCYVVRYP